MTPPFERLTDRQQRPVRALDGEDQDRKVAAAYLAYPEAAVVFSRTGTAGLRSALGEQSRRVVMADALEDSRAMSPPASCRRFRPETRTVTPVESMKAISDRSTVTWMVPRPVRSEGGWEARQLSADDTSVNAVGTLVGSGDPPARRLHGLRPGGPGAADVYVTVVHVVQTADGWSVDRWESSGSLSAACRPHRRRRGG